MTNFDRSTYEEELKDIERMDMDELVAYLRGLEDKLEAMSSRFRGVHYDRHKGKYQARIKVENRRIHLGYYDTDVEAARSYDRAAIKAFKETAQINFDLKDYARDLEGTENKNIISKRMYSFLFFLI